MSQRQYEILFIAEQNLGEPEVDTLTATVKGFAGKNDPSLANGRTLVLKDGRSFYIGSVGGPNDGAEQ